MRLSKKGALLAAAATAAAVFVAPVAHADECIGPLGLLFCATRPWDGQLMPTWNTPGYYGGFTNGPVMCNPFNLSCEGYAQP
jgi:hypothetical protein